MAAMTAVSAMAHPPSVFCVAELLGMLGRHIWGHQ